MYKLVLVDDEPWALTGLQEIIDWEKYGFDICEKYSSAEAVLKNIDSIKPDAVFADIRMPKISGIELLSILKKRQLDTEFVIVSAYSDFEVARDAITYGALGYILKPLNVSEVEKVVNRLKKKLDIKTQSLGEIDPDDRHSVDRIRKTLGKARLRSHHCIVFSEKPITSVTPGIEKYFFKIKGLVLNAYFFTSNDKRLPETAFYSASGMWKNDLTSFEDMINEAKAAYFGHFSYSAHETVCAMQYFLGTNYSKDIKLSHLAEEFFLSETYMCELFKKYTGDTINGFLKKIRISNSFYLLKHTNMGLSEISHQVGFYDYSYFGRTFKKMTGVTPNEYKLTFSGQ